MHLLTFTSWIYPETHFSTTFKTISVYLACKTSRVSTGSSQTTRNSLVSQKCQKYDQQNKFQNCIFNGNSFPKQFIFHRYRDIPSKVAHMKYTVAETCISSVKLITAIYVLKLLTMFFCIEFQKSSSC